MLEDHEWQLLKKIVKMLKPFDRLTTYFRRIQYTTLSIINLSIEALKFEFADGAVLTSDEIEKIINNEFNKSMYKTKLFIYKIKIKILTFF